MKTIRILGIALLTVLLNVTLLGCSKSDDDDNNNSPSTSIVGSWIIMESNGAIERLIFESDGSCKSYWDYGPDKPGVYYEEQGTYAIDDNILTIEFIKKISKGNANKEAVTTSISKTTTYIFSINGNKLTLKRKLNNGTWDRDDIWTRE